MNKKVFLWILLILVIQVIFGFLYIRFSSSLFHPIAAYMELVFGIFVGVQGMNYWNKYIKNEK